MLREYSPVEVSRRQCSMHRPCPSLLLPTPCMPRFGSTICLWLLHSSHGQLESSSRT